MRGFQKGITLGSRTSGSTSKVSVGGVVGGGPFNYRVISSPVLDFGFWILDFGLWILDLDWTSTGLSLDN